jgi:hypothetical protein
MDTANIRELPDVCHHGEALQKETEEDVFMDSGR